MESHNNKLITWPGNIVLVASVFYISMLAAWFTLSAANFFYPLLHDMIGIQQTIEEYAPKNVYKKSFDATTPEQRSELFRHIVSAINNRGTGLDEIHYRDAQGNVIGRLLREPEIIHLQDVARLLAGLRQGAWIAGAALLVIFTIYRLKGCNTPKPVKLLTGTAVGVLAAALLVTLFDAKETFYHWHTIIFPQGHQWFFYYEESLMTMLMKAPDIFAWLAALLLTATLVIFYLLTLLLHRLLMSRNRGVPAHEDTA